MAKKKEPAIIGALKIFFEGTKLYFKNIGKFSKYMAFPILGLFLGIILLFSTVHFFVNHIEKIVTINPAFNNVSVMFIIMIVLTIPSFMIFFAAFWKYLIAMGALNSMANNLISSAKLEDLSIHNDTVTRRMPTFLFLLLILSIISLIGTIPLLWVVWLIVLIYLSLTFQIFALNENLNAIEIIKKSIQLIKGNFFKTTLVLFFLWLFTFNILPALFNFAMTKLNLYDYLCIPVETFSQNLPLEEVQNTIQTILSAANNNLNYVLDIKEFAKTIVVFAIIACVIGFTLPLRSICCTLLYKDLETKKLKEKKIKEL